MATEESCHFSTFYLTILYKICVLEMVWSQNEQCSTLHCLAACVLKFFHSADKENWKYFDDTFFQVLNFGHLRHMSELEVSFLRLPIWSLESNWVSHSDSERKYNSCASGRASLFPVSTSEAQGEMAFLTWAHKATWLKFGSVSAPRDTGLGCIHVF